MCLVSHPAASLSRCLQIPAPRARAGSQRDSSQASFMPNRRSASHAARGMNWLASLEWLKTKFFVSAASFSSPVFSARRFSPSPSRPCPKTSPPFVVPSEDYSHEGGLGARLFREGRRTEDAQQSSKKKTMKTTSQKNNSGLRARSAQLSSRPQPRRRRSRKRKTIACRLTPRHGRRTGLCPHRRF